MDESKSGEAVARKTRANVTWTKEMKSDFLDHLAATCNVSASAQSIGVSAQSVYHLRRSDKPFRAAWLLAVESGYQMLETQLIGHALAGGGPALTNGDVQTTGPIDVALAQALLASYRARVSGTVHPPGRKGKTVTAEQTDASILKKLAAMDRARKRAGNRRA